MFVRKEKVISRMQWLWSKGFSRPKSSLEWTNVSILTISDICWLASRAWCLRFRLMPLLLELLVLLLLLFVLESLSDRKLILLLLFVAADVVEVEPPPPPPPFCVRAMLGGVMMEDILLMEGKLFYAMRYSPGVWICKWASSNSNELSILLCCLSTYEDDALVW